MSFRASAPGAALVLLLLALAYWYFQIATGASLEPLRARDADLYVEHYPMARYAFGVVASGALPLWNPHQLCGVPHLAVPFVGLFYPPNLVYALFDTGTATEVSLLGHLVFAGLCTWLLVRALGAGGAAALGAAFTFMLSGWMIHKVAVPSLISGMSWLPFGVWMVERTARGRRAGPFGLAVAVACQLLNGAAEFLVYNLYVAGLFASFRLVGCGRAEGFAVAARRGAWLLGAVVAGALLGAVQLLPSRELLQESVRAGAHFSQSYVTSTGTIGTTRYLGGVLSASGMAGVGCLPLFGVALGIGFGRQRGLWLFALFCGGLALALATGGPLWWLYYRTPFGGSFRFPFKLLHVHAFAAALLAAIALARLEDWRARRLSASALCREPGWIASCGLAGLALTFLAVRGATNAYLLGALFLLLLFAAVPGARVRAGIVAALVLLQGASLFQNPSDSPARPAFHSEAFDAHGPLLEDLGRRAGLDRVYLSSRFLASPALMQKQGMLRGLYVVGDYNPLTPRSAEEFFRRAAGPSFRRRHFAGWLPLGEDSRWQLLDLASTRFYVVRPGEPLDGLLERAARRSRRPDVRRIAQEDGVRVYERDRGLPRSYVVGAARWVAPEATLDAVLRDDFDPRREVVLASASDGGPGVAELRTRAPASGGASGPAGRAEIAAYAAERVAIDVEAPRPGFLVLTDRYASGWKARVGEREVPIRRANHLFRAVAVPAGYSRVEFAYHPDSFRRGAFVSGATAIALVALWLWGRRIPGIG